jgi:lycopene cyclase domain-containing protein
MDKQFTYLFLIVITIAGPIALSFDKKVAFYKNFKHFLISAGITSLIYIIWDIIFTRNNIWKFNDPFILKYKLFNLPIEEYLFFVVVPYASLFIYECIKNYFPNLKIGGKLPWRIILVFSILMLLFNISKLYTVLTFGLLSVLILFVFIGNSKIFQSTSNHLFAAWVICLLPMSYVNGVLTSKPILIYNDTENCTLRIGSIPLEDFFYHLLYMVIMIFIYEYIKSIKHQKTSK